MSQKMSVAVTGDTISYSDGDLTADEVRVTIDHSTYLISADANGNLTVRTAHDPNIKLLATRKNTVNGHVVTLRPISIG